MINRIMEFVESELDLDELIDDCVEEAAKEIVNSIEGDLSEMIVSRLVTHYKNEVLSKIEMEIDSRL